MGMDFVALIKYAGPGTWLDPILDRFEVGHFIPELDSLVTHLNKIGYYLMEAGPAPQWWQPENRVYQNVVPRPSLPERDTALHLRGDFFLTFGEDTIRTYSGVRWYFFLTDLELQQRMVAAVRMLCKLFNASDCVIMSDFHPADSAIFDGLKFDEALQAGSLEDGERSVLADLCWEYVSEDDLDWAFDDKGDNVSWPRDKLLPEGWERITTWDSKGYWRLPLDNH